MLVPAALVQFLSIHKGNIHMEGMPATSQPRVADVILAGKDKERFDRKVLRLWEANKAESEKMVDYI